jgi:hypothetical protein
MMEWLLPLIGGLGIGSLLSAIVNQLLSNKMKLKGRLYEEKRETYLGLIEALRNCDIHPSRENAKAYGAWHVRCKLFGSDEVVKSSQRLIDTCNDVHGDAPARVYEDLFEAMRRDIRR